ncbi:DUF7525 family protein [Halorhabdus utahensis]|nr:hypothetical protein [Halorhabdus utahensis]
MPATIDSEKGFGLTILFGVLALAGALVMLLGAADNLVAAAGFALAIGAGSAAVAASHAFD